MTNEETAELITKRLRNMLDGTLVPLVTRLVKEATDNIPYQIRHIMADEHTYAAVRKEIEKQVRAQMEITVKVKA